MNSWESEGAPHGNVTDFSGFIGPSHRSGESLKRLIMAYVPLKPLQSLGELQDFDVTQYNYTGPHQYNVIGNSHAHPAFAPDEISIDYAFLDPEGTTRYDLAISDIQQYDHSYVMNKVLFDDWFFSSIAPDTINFSSHERRSLEQVYIDHLSGKESLPNQCYQPSQMLSASDAAAVVTADLSAQAGQDPYERIASKLVVDGMFNINSTSVAAWEAVLKHLKDASVPYLDENGEMALSTGEGHPIARGAIAGEGEAGSLVDTSGNDFPEANEFTGFRRFSDEQIEELAQLIVKEVKLRGPFLSLSEFINRRLTSEASEQDLARAGVIEAALLALSESAENNPYAYLLSTADKVSSLPEGDHKFQFPYASYGSTAYGYPGWTRQADILRPLAPILSARDDTFTIRAYGDERDSQGRIKSQAWCEAVVQRVAEFVDPSDAATDKVARSTSEAGSSAYINNNNFNLGRKFKIISFRWLEEDEI